MRTRTPLFRLSITENSSLFAKPWDPPAEFLSSAGRLAERLAGGPQACVEGVRVLGTAGLRVSMRCGFSGAESGAYRFFDVEPRTGTQK